MDLPPTTDDRPALVQQLELEQAAISTGSTRCGARCPCHGAVVCARTAHPHDGDDEQPHIGYDDQGQLVQWAHTDVHGPVLTDAEVAEATAAARRDFTRVLLAQLDLDELRAALAAGGA